MIFIIGLILSLIVILIMMDTHICVYYCYYSGILHDCEREYDFEIKVWHILLIIFVGLIPILNIVLFLVWLLYYIIHASWNPKNCTGDTHIPYLRGKNILTKFLLFIKKILTKKL